MSKLAFVAIWAIITAFGIAMGVLGLWLGRSYTEWEHTPQGQCPTEDSCTSQYYDHAWHIRKVTP